MRYILTVHTQKRITERVIPKELIDDALQNPTKAIYNAKRQLVIKKLYQKQGKERLLLIIGENIGDQLKIITVIDTSKIEKYL